MGLKDAVRNRPITHVWHPKPPCALLEIGNNITARVLVGEPAYQLVTGEIVTL
jgi:hypothetical protein